MTSVYSLNVPLPPPVRELAASLRPALVDFDRVRDDRSRTLVLKRLEADDRREFLATRRDAREALRGAPVVEAAIQGVGVFDDPPAGSGPVAYLAVESPGLHELHERLTDSLGAVPGLEGEAYTPHVTLARGGDACAAETIMDVSVEAVTWTVDEIEFYDARHGERIEAVSLPA